MWRILKIGQKLARTRLVFENYQNKADFEPFFLKMTHFWPIFQIMVVIRSFSAKKICLVEFQVVSWKLTFFRSWSIVSSCSGADLTICRYLLTHAWRDLTVNCRDSTLRWRLFISSAPLVGVVSTWSIRLCLNVNRQKTLTMNMFLNMKSITQCHIPVKKVIKKWP